MKLYKWGMDYLKECGVKVIDGDRGQEYPQSFDFSDKGVCLFLNAKNVTKAGFRFDECQFISKHKHEKLRKGKLERNDLVFTTRGSVGNVAIYNQNVPFDIVRINSGMVILRNSGETLYQKFLHVFLTSSLFDRQLKPLIFGSAQPQLTVGIIKKLKIPCPSKPEQKKIAEIILTWDDSIKKTTKLVETKLRIKKGLMQNLLTGNIRLKKFEKERWQDCTVKDFGTVITGTTPSKSHQDYYGGSFPWATAEDFKGKYIKDTVIKLSQSGKNVVRPLPKGSVLVTCIASIGKNALAGCDLATNQQINAIIVNKQHDNEFVFYLIDYFRNKLVAWAGVTAVPILNKKTFEKVPFTIPLNKEEQREISSILATADHEIEALQLKLDMLHKQKKGLVQKLLSGKIRLKT